MAVPTHYFKVVLVEGRGHDGRPQTAVGAFVLPNAPIDPAQPLLTYAMPLEVVESVSGLQFFPGYINDQRREALDTSALGADLVTLFTLASWPRVHGLDSGQCVSVL